ncbi:MAG: hypothetical protein O7G85_14795 [Planctomycetota bacterium]|nr:hypothetical protein [Planctomycetota bacterium]
MSWFPSNLWDFLTKPSRKVKPRPKRQMTPKREPGPPVRSGTSMQKRYDDIVVEMKKTYGIRIRKWRSSMSGCAWEVHYASGSVSRLLESPYPKGPMSCAIFLHEIGHHAIGFRTYRPRCLEEYHAWKWSLDMMRKKGINVTKNVEKRMADSLKYAVQKAQRRGLKHVPPQLLPFLESK